MVNTTQLSHVTILIVVVVLHFWFWKKRGLKVPFYIHAIALCALLLTISLLISDQSRLGRPFDWRSLLAALFLPALIYEAFFLNSKAPQKSAPCKARLQTELHPLENKSPFDD